MISLETPSGCTLIVEEGCIHGDSNMKGMFLMAMTCNHNLMNTADSVFLRVQNDLKTTVKVFMEDDDF